MQKPMLLALLFCRKNYCWRIYANLQSCFQNSFQLVFYTSLTLRHCNALSAISNSPTTKAKFPIKFPAMFLILSSPLWSIFALLHIVYNTLLQLYSKRCNIEPYLVTFILRILLLHNSELHPCLLQNSKLTRLKITVQNSWLALA